MTRAERIHRTKCIKQGRKHYVMLEYLSSERKIGLFTETPKACSCHMCGNSRKHFRGKLNNELTINELRDLERFEYDIEALYMEDICVTGS